jgi:DNA-binding MarR family transcriptional regulator
MASRLPSDIWRLGSAVTPTEKLLLLALVDYGAKIHPSQGTLALKTGLSVRTVGDTIASLRRKGLVSTLQRGAKAMSYTVTLTPPRSADIAEHDRQPLPRRSAVIAETIGNGCRGILTSQGTSQPNQGPADAGTGGWEVSLELRNRITARDPRADFDAQAKVCRRIMAQHGLTLDEAQRSWLALCAAWANTGNNAYELLAKATLNMADARSPRSLLLHRLKEVVT